jgi:hypothetical protein
MDIKGLMVEAPGERGFMTMALTKCGAFKFSTRSFNSERKHEHLGAKTFYRMALSRSGISPVRNVLPCTEQIKFIAEDHFAKHMNITTIYSKYN